MDRHTPERGGPPQRRLPLGLAGMLVLVWVVEGFVARSGGELTDLTSLTWRVSAGEACRNQGFPGILCFGDSQVKMGVLPTVIEDRTGLPARNLAVLAGQASSSYVLLRRAIDSGARPGAVIVNFHNDFLSAAPQTNAPHWPELLGLRDAADLVLTSRDPLLLGRLGGSWLLPTLKARLAVRAAIRSALNGAPTPEVATLRAARRNLEVNRGACVVAEMDQTKPRPPAPERPRLRPVNRAYIERFLDLAAANDITVVWVMLPVHPSWQSRCDRLGLDQAPTEYARSARRRYPRLVVVDARHAGYDARLFLDNTHLNRRGALALSAALASILAPYLGPSSPALAGRWVDLPAYQEPAEFPQIEDVHQSSLAIGTPGPVRR